MVRYLIQRIAQFALVILGATAVVFVAMYVATDPARTALPVGTPDEDVEAFRRQLGLDEPLLVQYLSFLWDAVRGDFGTSIWLGRPALDLVLESLPATAALALPATLIGVLLGVGCGVLVSMRPGSRLDNAVNVLGYGLISLAEFWLAIMLIMLVAVQFDLVPTAALPGHPASLILPVAILAIRPFAHQTQMMRSSMIAERGRQYVTTARSKGLSETRVALRHMLRNAAIPSVSLGVYELSRLFVGTAVAIEIVFAWPGIGRLAAEALERGDIFVVQAVVVVAVVVVASLNLVADLLSFWLDPRTRTELRSTRTVRSPKGAAL
ncbi:ABC transporter permease [Actinomadura cremea]|nr:ABC transporter permease [Actinomadura cremea]